MFNHSEAEASQISKGVSRVSKKEGKTRRHELA